MLSAFISSLRTPDLRRKILFTLGIVILYRVGASIPSPGVNYPNVHEVRCAGHRRRLGADLLVDQPVLRRRAAASDGVRGRHHAVHHRQHHRSAAGRRDPALRAAAQRGSSRPGETDPVHPLPDGRAGHPAGHQHRGAGRQRRAAAGLHPRHHPGAERRPEHLHADRHRVGADGRRGAGDVDGRAGHRARHRQRHVADDLRRHRRAHPDRRQDHPGQPRRHGVHRGLRGRTDHHHRRGVRRAGPTAHPRAVRQAHGGQAHVRRHVYVPAAQGQPGRRYPGHLRVVADLHPAPDHPADHQWKARTRATAGGRGSSPTT